MGRITVDLNGIITASNSYYIKIDEGFVVDSVTSKPNDAVTTDTEIVFTTNPGPDLDFSHPADNETDYNFQQPAVITIPLYAGLTEGTGDVRVYNYSTDALVDTITLDFGEAGNATVDGLDLIVQANERLDDTVTYYVLYDATIMVDTNDPVPSCFTGTPPSFPAETNKDNLITIDIDTTDPTVTGTSSVELLFPFAVTLETGNIYLYRTSDDVLIETFDVTTDVSGNGTNTLLMTPYAILIDDTIDYYLLTDAGIVTDADGYLFDGVLVKNVYGCTSPRFTFKGVTATLGLYFDKDVLQGPGTITVHRGVDDAVVASTKTFTNNIVSITATLSQGTQYYILVENGAVLDGIGEAYAGISAGTDLNFTTKIWTTEIVSTLPLDNATGVATLGTAGLAVTFDDVGITVGTGNIGLYESVGDALVESFDVTTQASVLTDTITTDNLSVGVDALTDYYVLMDPGAVIDTGHIGFGGIASPTVFNFTTAAAPGIASTLPVDNASGFRGGDISITMSEDIAAGTGNIYLYETTGNVLTETFAPGSFSIVDDTVTVSNSVVLKSFTDYYVLMDSGAVKSLSSMINNSEISSATEFNFTTGDVQIATTSPADNSEFNPNLDFSITFDKDITVATGNIYLYETTGNVLIGTYDVTSDVSVVGATLSVDNALTPTLNKDYYVKMDANAVYDSDNLYFAGIADSTTFNFKTGGVPSLASTLPVDNASAVGTNPTITATYDRNIVANSGSFDLYKLGITAVAQVFKCELDADGPGALHRITINGTDYEWTSNSGAPYSTAEERIQALITMLSGAPVIATHGGSTSGQPVLNGIYITAATPGTAFTCTSLASVLEQTVEVVANVAPVADLLIKAFDSVSDATYLTNTATLTSVPTLTTATDYYIVIDAGAVKDSMNSGCIAVTDKDIWNFST